jgi:hypothetical protein
MASTATNVNITHMNVKQLRKVAKDVNVDPVIINSYMSQNSGKSGLITAIKAK